MKALLCSVAWSLAYMPRPRRGRRCGTCMCRGGGGAGAGAVPGVAGSGIGAHPCCGTPLRCGPLATVYDHALDRICLMAPVDAHLDRLFLFNWIRAKSGGHTTGAGAHRARVHLAVEAISCPYRGRVRTFIFPFLLGLRTPIEGSSSHCIRSRSGCLRRRSCEINF